MNNARNRDDAADFVRDCIIIALVSGTTMVLFGCAVGFVVGLVLIFRKQIANLFRGRA